MHFHLPHVIICNHHPLYTGIPMTYTSYYISYHSLIQYVCSYGTKQT